MLQHKEITRVEVEVEMVDGDVMSFTPRCPDKENQKEQLQARKHDTPALIQRLLFVKDRFRISDEALH